MAFEYDLASALRPRLVLDLGAGDGSSFLTYCQAACDRQFEIQCYAADQWKTRRTAGTPDFNELRDFVRRYYMGLVTLVESPASDLLDHFHPGSIDLLRIDGTLEIAPSVIAEWMARMSSAGVVVICGVDAAPGSAAWQAASPGRICFELSGLGAALAPDGGDDAGLLALLRSPEEHADLARFYEHVALHHLLRRETDPARGGALR